MEIKELLFFFASRLEWSSERVPNITAPDRSGQRTDLQSTFGPPLGQASGPSFGRHERRFISVAAAAAPKPLSMLTTVRPAAQELSIAKSAARPWKLAP